MSQTSASAQNTWYRQKINQSTGCVWERYLVLQNDVFSLGLNSPLRFLSKMWANLRLTLVLRMDHTASSWRRSSLSWILLQDKPVPCLYGTSGMTRSHWALFNHLTKFMTFRSTFIGLEKRDKWTYMKKEREEENKKLSEKSKHSTPFNSLRRTPTMLYCCSPTNNCHYCF